MSNQIVISSGAKLRGLNGVITGTTGVLDSVPLGGANGVATLDSSGKVPVSQLPSSVVTYLGTWNAATNTPTLANGTGDAGDMYICNVAGTVDFGAGPITFAVGDWVLYGSGTWQKSNGQNGTVTSVAVTESGDALTITGSPITTSGTINIGFAGTSAQYVAGNGSLITFPSLTGYVPYTGATADVDLGTFKLNAQSLHVKGTGGNGHLGLKHQSATATASASESSLFANVNGDLGWKNDNLYLTTFNTHANTADRVYTFPDASGTVAITSDLSSYVPYTGATTSLNMGSNSISSTYYSSQGDGTNGGSIYLRQRTQLATATTNYSAIGAFGGYTFYFSSNDGTTNRQFKLNSYYLTTLRNYFLPDADGTLALTSDIPSLSATAPISYSGGVISISQATTSTNGYLSSTDWNNFQTAYANRIQSASSPLAFSMGILTIQQATTSTNGYLSSTDWNTFNNKVSSQWTTSGSNIYYTSGNVGIGTSSPSNKLHVVGANGVIANFVGASGNYGQIYSDTNAAIFGASSSTSLGINYLYINPSSNFQAFITNDNERMRITSSGNVGIGTSSPSSYSHGGTNVALEVQNGGTSANSQAHIMLSTGATTNTGSIGTLSWAVPSCSGNKLAALIASNIESNSSTNITANITFYTNNAGSLGERMRITSGGDIQFKGASTGTNQQANITNDDTYFTLYPSNSGSVLKATRFMYNGGSAEAMRITSGGDVCIGTTTVNDKLTINGGIRSIGSSAGYFWNDRSNAANFYGWYATSNVVYFFNGSANAASITPSTGVYTPLSDINKKKDFEDSKIGLNAILGLKPTLYRMKDEEGTKKHLGFIAQQVKEFIPQAYVEEGDFIGLQDRPIIAALVKAVQELKAEIDELKNK